jgi:hypothetical protein
MFLVNFQILFSRFLNKSSGNLKISLYFWKISRKEYMNNFWDDPDRTSQWSLIQMKFLEFEHYRTIFMIDWNFSSLKSVKFLPPYAIFTLSTINEPGRCFSTSKPPLIIHYFRECFMQKFFAVLVSFMSQQCFESNRHEAKVAYIIENQSRSWKITSFAIFRSAWCSL